MLLAEQLYDANTNSQSPLAIFNLIFSCNAALVIFILEVRQCVVVLTFRHYGKNASLSTL